MTLTGISQPLDILLIPLTLGNLRLSQFLGIPLVLVLAMTMEFSLKIRWHLVLRTSFQGTPSGAWSTSASIRGQSGHVNLADSTSNEWYITGVQAEVGDVATAFEHRSFGDELARCQRYFEIQKCIGWSRGGDNLLIGSISYKVENRAAPSSVSATKTNGGGSGTVNAFQSSVHGVGIYQSGGASGSDCTYQVLANSEL